MTRYIVMVFAGACSFGILSTFVKLAYRKGYSAATIAASQAFTGLVVLAILFWLFKRRQPGHAAFQLARQHWMPLFFTGIAIGLTTFVYYVSVQYIPASLAIVLLMQFTWMGMLLEWLLHRKRPGWLQVVATVVILAGTIMAGGLLPLHAVAWPIKGILYALASALFYAIYVVANSRTSNGLHPVAKSVVIMLGSTTGIVLVNARSLMTDSYIDAGLIPWALFLALFGTIIPPVLFAKGIPKIGAGISAIIMTAELPVAVICSHLLLQEPVDAWQWTGVVIMLVAIGILQWLQSKK